MSLFTFTLIFGIFVSEEQLPSIELGVQPNDIGIGNFIKLTWAVTNAKNIFISGYGKVTSTGMLSIRPDKTTSFTLIAENDAGIASKTVTVRVRGIRGEFDFPDRSLFRYSKSYRTSTPSVVNFVDHVYTILQDTMGFRVDDLLTMRDDRFILITNRLQIDYLIKHHERQRIATWRIAYLVEIEKPNSQSKESVYFIKAIIEYKRKVEQRWRLEEDELLYNLGIQKLSGAINQVP
jgi:hypothetical protein